MSILLCGLPGCGKTTIGELLAKRLSYSFVDTDHLIEQHFSKLSCREIFLQMGEKAFRALEAQMLESLCGCAHTIIALGGGILETSGNEIMLKNMGEVFYLKVPVEVIWSRLLKRDLPAYLDQKDTYGSFIELVQRRSFLYEKVADKIVDIGYLSQEDALKKILEICVMYGK